MTGSGIYRFGDVEVDANAHRLTRDGTELSLEPKAFAVLLALLEEAGKAVERDALLDRVWGHRHVTPGVLNRVIAHLRKALGDDAEHPRYIQTLHSLGYRFIAEVEHAGADIARQVPDTVPQPASAPAGHGAAVPVPAVSSPQDPAAGRPHGFVLAIIATVVVIALALLNQTREPAKPAASIAVLPFTSLSSSIDDSYFAEGLAVEMHDALAGVPGLVVAARMSPAAPVPGDADLKALGRRLGVATVLQATVRREGTRLRISARLTATDTGYTLWSRTYDRRMSDVFATQSEIAGDVAQSLTNALPETRQALASRLTPTSNVAAFDAYLKGLQELLRPAGSERAIGYFEQALAQDKGFSRAQAAICRSEVSRFENRRSAEAMALARDACDRALRMDPESGEVSLALGELHHAQGDLGKAVEYYAKAEQDMARRPAALVGMAIVQADQGRPGQAAEYFRRALELRPGDASIHAHLGYQQYLAGKTPEAIASFRRSVELRPDDPDLWSTLGGLYFVSGDNPAAVAALERSIAIRPGYSALSNLGEIRYQQGNYKDAADLHRRATRLEPSDYLPWGNLGDALLAEPENAEAARDAYRQAAERALRYVEIKSNDAKAIAALGWFQANLGQPVRAREAIRRSEALGGEAAEVALYNAQTFALLDEPGQARKRVAAARAAGMSEARLTANAVLQRGGLLH